MAIIYCWVNIYHRTTRVRSPQINGFVERFNRTVLDVFSCLTFRKSIYESVEQLKTIWTPAFTNTIINALSWLS